MFNGLLRHTLQNGIPDYYDNTARITRLFGDHSPLATIIIVFLLIFLPLDHRVKLNLLDCE